MVMDHLGVRLCRNLHQSRAGGFDLVVHPDEDGPIPDVLRRFAIEVKRHQRATESLLEKWWAQAVGQAQPDGLVPCLAHREDRQPWRVTVPMDFVRQDLHQGDELRWTFTMSVPAFCAVVRESAWDG